MITIANFHWLRFIKRGYLLTYVYIFSDRQATCESQAGVQSGVDASSGESQFITNVIDAYI